MKIDLRRSFVLVVDHSEGPTHQILSQGALPARRYPGRGRLRAIQQTTPQARDPRRPARPERPGAPSREEFETALEQVGLTRGLARKRKRVSLHRSVVRHIVCAWITPRLSPSSPGSGAAKPCIRGTPHHRERHLEYLASGMSEAEILEDFPELTGDDIRACLAFAADRVNGGILREWHEAPARPKSPRRLVGALSEEFPGSIHVFRPGTGSIDDWCCGSLRNATVSSSLRKTPIFCTFPCCGDTSQSRLP